MKKTLSVLLILAAIFGFYGGAVNLTDVLACKSYWEEEGKKTTADLNKLEDGINELQENEEAYLDGLDQVKDGEIKLADGRKTLADGEAEYKAAPAKIEAGKKKLAVGQAAYDEGVSDLNDGKASLQKLKELIDGLKSINSGFESEWHPGFVKEPTDMSDAGLKPARAIITGQLGKQAAEIALVEQLSEKTNLLANLNNAGSYKEYDDAIRDIIVGFTDAKKKLTDFAGKADGAKKDLGNVVIGLNSAIQGKQDILDKVAPMAEEQLLAVPDGDEKQAYRDEYKRLQKTVEDTRATCSSRIKGTFDALGSNIELVKTLNEPLYNSIKHYSGILITNAAGTTDQDFKDAAVQLQGNLEALSGALKGKAASLEASKAPLAGWDKGWDKLVKGQTDLATGVQNAYGGMLANPVIANQLEAKGILPAITYYASPVLTNMDLEKFDGEMQKVVAINKQLIPVLQATYNQGMQTIQEGEAKLSSAAILLKEGKAQLADALAAYAAAPGKLADGRAQLATGEKDLADGKAKLAEYEDGESQVRDGLATLTSSEPSGGLTSILARLKNDDNFDNPNGHLLLGKGLKAVDVGRGYQADSGVIITKELTNRSIGSVAGLVGGVLAVLAALLSFVKKNKAAGILALLAGAAGVVGIVIGKGAGMEMSTMAGSLIGATPYIAFGILAGVALIHAITHFTAKKSV